ncbi:hypothetical protein GBF38_017058 [Nibea albiflora]|uniref:Uncharacterized protein n=1 Tax=Nibea albiflora TaxID=240163 RepID=A0ACB7EEM5_NIBAL|nr:hypothetical protein GBF38_017058 [Nibea albiflora]
MSESPPYERDAASASPESPEEEDFSHQPLCDNPNCLEEHEAHEDHKDPIIIMQDNSSGSPLNARVSGPVSPEFMEVRGLDGRFITLVSSQTQTDWEWVEQSLSFSCQVQKEIEDLQLLQAAVEESVDTGSSQVICSCV